MAIALLYDASAGTSRVLSLVAPLMLLALLLVLAPLTLEADEVDALEAGGAGRGWLKLGGASASVVACMTCLSPPAIAAARLRLSSFS